MHIANVQLGDGVLLTHPDLVNIYRCRIGEGPKRVATRISYRSGDMWAPHLSVSVSAQAQDRTIQLPRYPQMTRAEQDQLVAALGEAVRH